jgi:hypothetical protein
MSNIFAKSFSMEKAVGRKFNVTANVGRLNINGLAICVLSSFLDLKNMISIMNAPIKTLLKDTV